MFSKDFDAGQLNPYVRYVHVSFNTAKMHSVPERELYDFGLIFVMEGELTFEYGGDTVVLRENDLHIMPPGLRHKEYIRPDAACWYANMHFDMVYCPHRRNWSIHEMYLNACCDKYVRYAAPDTTFVDAGNINNNIMTRPLLIRYEAPAEIQRKLNAVSVSYERNLYNPSTNNELWLKKYMLDLLLFIFTPAEMPGERKIESVVSLFIEYVQEDMTKEFDYNAFARANGYSPNYFRKIFKDAMHVTPWEYVKQVRLRKARQLLREGILSVREVAAGVGFEDTFYFSKFFKKEVGCSPSAYRRFIDDAAGNGAPGTETDGESGGGER